MQYFKDEAGALYAFEDDVSQELIDTKATQFGVSFTALDEDAYQSALEPTAAEQEQIQADEVRATRDELADRTSREINRLEDAGTDASDWRQYRIALRNVPEQDGFPFDVQWPEAPGDFTGK
ncbi:phage tail assembly chaperone [Celerinatantimonas sp. MCCC 1A17872]|uniref:phage tail assembly chaperone n=1 Tax=Celerinatantimonas sp. MCCC 1A17872 TaxID=3177514 RepID=UPI0038CA675B